MGFTQTEPNTEIHKLLLRKELGRVWDTPSSSQGKVPPVHSERSSRRCDWGSGGGWKGLVRSVHNSHCEVWAGTWGDEELSGLFGLDTK